MGVGGQHHASAVLPPRKTRYQLYRRLDGPPGPVWTGAENLAVTGIRSPDRPASSEPLYRLSYRCRNSSSSLRHYFSTWQYQSFGALLESRARLRACAPFWSKYSEGGHRDIRWSSPNSGHINNFILTAKSGSKHDASVEPRRPNSVSRRSDMNMKFFEYFPLLSVREPRVSDEKEFRGMTGLIISTGRRRSHLTSY